MTEQEMQEALVDHAARQTKALENINLVLMFFFGVAVLAFLGWLATIAF